MSIVRLNQSILDEPIVEQSWDFQSDETRWMLSYWKQQRGDRPRPKLSDIDLLTVYENAKLSIIKDALNDGKDFRVRYWSTGLANWLRYDATGKNISEYYPTSGIDNLLEVNRLALFGDTPVRRYGKSIHPDRDHLKFETILLPLDNDAAEPSFVISATTFYV